MKILTIIAVTAAVIGLSACAHKEPASSSSTMSHHSSYSK